MFALRGLVMVHVVLFGLLLWIKQCLMIALRGLVMVHLAWLAFTGTLNLLTHLRYYFYENIFCHSHFILWGNRYRYRFNDRSSWPSDGTCCSFRCSFGGLLSRLWRLFVFSSFSLRLSCSLFTTSGVVSSVKRSDDDEYKTHHKLRFKIVLIIRHSDNLALRMLFILWILVNVCFLCWLENVYFI